MDNEKKDKNPDAVYDFYDGLWSRMKKETADILPIPGLGDMPPQRNIFGEPIHYPSGMFEESMSTIFSNSPKDDDAEREIIRLEMDGKSAKMVRNENRHLSLSMPSRVINKSEDGETFQVRLTPEQYDQRVVESGRGLRKALNALIKSDTYKNNMNDEDRKLEIKLLINIHRQNGTELLGYSEDVQDDLRRKMDARGKARSAPPVKIK